MWWSAGGDDGECFAPHLVIDACRYTAVFNDNGAGRGTCANKRKWASALDTGYVVWGTYSVQVRRCLAFHERVDERTVVDGASR